jgi:hypothetical protein
VDFSKVLSVVATFFEREGFRFAAVGAFGLHAYGLSRATLDLDLATESRAQTKLITFLESLGYETLHRSAGYSSHLHPHADLGRIDLVHVDGETSRLLFGGGGTTLRLGGQVIPVPRADSPPIPATGETGETAETAGGDRHRQSLRKSP